MARPVVYMHIRSRNNGIPLPTGGYTVAVQRRTPDDYRVVLCQCRKGQAYNPKLGEKIAQTKLSRGQFLVQDKPTLVTTLEGLHAKSCEGLTPRLNLEALSILNPRS